MEGAIAIAIVQCLLTTFASGLVIDNSVMGDPNVECTGEQVAITFTTQKAFNGRVFVRGYAAQKDCVMSGDEHPVGLSLGFTQCGVQRSRQLNPPGMIVYTTVIISFHPIFVTKMDRAYRVACHYMEAIRTVTADMEVSMLSTAAMTSSPSMPECRYEILIGGPSGQAAKYARVGDQIYHRWTCDSKDNAYCMRVHSCTVDDGQGSESYMVINRQGCATDKFILQNLDYPTDLMAGQETHVVKFADKASLFFSCQIELLSKASESANCATARPNCSEPGTLAVVTNSSSALAPAPVIAHVEADGPVRRRAARRVGVPRNQSTLDLVARQNFQVVGDMDLLRQQLTVLDLDDSPSDDEGNFARAQARRQPSTSTTAMMSSSTTPASIDLEHHIGDTSHIRERLTLVGPICVSPLGFGIALFAVLIIFLIALGIAVRYATPLKRMKKGDDQVVVDYSTRNRYFSSYFGQQ